MRFEGGVWDGGLCEGSSTNRLIICLRETKGKRAVCMRWMIIPPILAISCIMQESFYALSIIVGEEGGERKQSHKGVFE